MHDLESFPDVLNGSLRCRNVLNTDFPTTHEKALEGFYIVQFCNKLNYLS